MPPLRWTLAPLLAVLATAATAPDTKVAIVKAILHDGDDGPPITADHEYSAGELVFFSFLVSGYKKVGSEPDEKIDVAYEMNVRDSQGVLLDPPNVGSVGTAISHEDKDWLPKVRYQFAIPPIVDPGEYKITIKLWDRFGKTETSLDMPFRVGGRKVESSDTLAVRNFRFLRGEEDKEPLTIAAYRPGDTIWARFDMTGYKFGDGNAFDIDYGVAVALPDGTVTYSQPHAAEEKSKTYYPQRYTPGVVSLNVPGDIKKGEYTLIVTVKDNLGNQSAEARGKFTVE